MAPPPDRPAPPTELAYDACAQLKTDALGFLEIVAANPLLRLVGSCPGWNLGDLAWHVSVAWTRWGRIVGNRMTTPEEVLTLEQPPRPTDDRLLDWATSAYLAVHSALVEVSSDTEVWTWTGSNQPAIWAARRMAQETAVHRWDAADSVGIPHRIPAEVAADGIDEFMLWFAARRVSEGAEAVGGSLQLSCTDVEEARNGDVDPGSVVTGSWLVQRIDESGAAFERGSGNADATVSATANDLLLWLWRRGSPQVEIVGDIGVAERFRNITAL